jgi:tRNA A-37 threonylcarbamoyl transferase component Bud32
MRTTTVTKKTSMSEYLIQKKLYAIIPKYVPKPISYKQGVMTMMKHGVSLKTWIKKHPTVSTQVLKQIIKNVRLILMKIRRKYPGFRHMDLHLGNLLFYKGRIMIIDFDRSSLKARKVCSCYDYHFFLNSLRTLLLKTKRSVGYINRILPEELRGSKNKYVSNYRLKSSESAAAIAKRLMGVR